MGVLKAEDCESMRLALELMEPGDCVEISSFSAVADNSREMLGYLLKMAESQVDFVCLQGEVDTRGDAGKSIIRFCGELAGLDRKDRRRRQQEGIDRAREEGKYRGRKPIEVDDHLFEAVIEQWESGKITARNAMEQLSLKPNTFYRRIKAWKEERINVYRKAEREMRAEVKEAARQTRRDLGELKKQVHSEAKEIRKMTEEHLTPHDAEAEQ